MEIKLVNKIINNETPSSMIFINDKLYRCPYPLQELSRPCVIPIIQNTPERITKSFGNFVHFQPQFLGQPLFLGLKL